MPTIRVQSVLYDHAHESIVRSLEFLDNATRNARNAGAAQHVMIAYGDCSSDCTIDGETLQDLRRQFSNLKTIDYTYFGANLGLAGGHNSLLKSAACDFVMILNPDVLVSPTLIGEMITVLGHPGVGLVEARQLPIEHPKDYDPSTGETSWASMACVMGPTKMFHRLRGFDAETFFLCCYDVDYSWRVRLAGYKVVFQCSAVVFHDKRLGIQGGPIASAANRYYSAEAELLLPYKYSRSDLTDRYLETFRKSDDEAEQKAAMAFDLRKKTGRLPTPIDGDHAVAQFVGGGYAHHRFKVL